MPKGKNKGGQPKAKQKQPKAKAKQNQPKAKAKPPQPKPKAEPPKPKLDDKALGAQQAIKGAARLDNLLPPEPKAAPVEAVKEPPKEPPKPPPPSPEEVAYGERFKVVQPLYAANQPKTDAGVQPKFVEWWKEIETLATAKNFAAGLVGLNQMDKALTEAQTLTATALKVRAAQTRAAKILDKTAMATAIASLEAAEELLKKLGKLATAEAELKAATLAFESAGKEATKALKDRAKNLEAADGGHSVDRHGPDVTDDLLKRRVEQGIAADGVLSPTHSSTKFDKIEDWLETRQSGIEESLKEMGVKDAKTAPADLTKTTITMIIEHGRPIDSGFCADKTSAADVPRKDATGGPVYELNKGKKKWRRNASEEPVDENGKVVSCNRGKQALDVNGDVVAPDDRDSATWPKGQNPPAWKLDTYTVYSKHEKVSGLTRSLTTLKWDGTNWKVVQHFPHAENWDPKQNKYTDVIVKFKVIKGL